jgi:5'-3' exonuclease
MKYLLIDGNNLAIRCAFANEGLKNQIGISTGVHFGILKSLIGLKKKFYDFQFLIAWDSKSKRRMEESRIGVDKGLIPSLYKDNRKKGDDLPEAIADFYKESDFIKKGIDTLGIPQIMIEGYEADDVIASYAKKLGSENKVIIVTSDRDYWQILSDNVSLWDGMKNIEITKQSWEQEYGLDVNQVVDMGAFVGDSGDNIFGVPGWGEKTAIKEIRKYGSMEKILDEYKNRYSSLRVKYPDITDLNEFEIIKNVKTDPDKENAKNKFPEININMPYTGVCKAFHEGGIKLPKTELMALMFEERLRLSYSLKKMDDNIEDLPEIEMYKVQLDKTVEFLEYYDIYTLHEDIKIFE